MSNQIATGLSDSWHQPLRNCAILMMATLLLALGGCTDQSQRPTQQAAQLPPSLAKKVSVIGQGIESQQLTDILPTLVQNVVAKMGQNGVSQTAIKSITIDGDISQGAFNGGDVWVKSTTGGSYLLDVNPMGSVTSFDKTK